MRVSRICAILAALRLGHAASSPLMCSSSKMKSWFRCRTGRMEWMAPASGIAMCHIGCCETANKGSHPWTRLPRSGSTCRNLCFSYTALMRKAALSCAVSDTRSQMLEFFQRLPQTKRIAYALLLSRFICLDPISAIDLFRSHRKMARKRDKIDAV
jgi:hypothetical protein